MKFNYIRTGLAAVGLMVSICASSQDLIARQAPIDKKLKSVDSLILQKQIQVEQSEFPAFDLYPSWNQTSVHGYSNANIPETYTFDLTGFAMPTPSTRVTSKFGPRGRRMHNGIDVKVQIGDTIYAAFDGKTRMVRDQGRRKGYGKYIVIRHDNGLETVYGHLSEHLVEEDKLVKAGEPIGLGGNTGRSYGSHLHFETRFLGVAINPALLFDFENQDIVADTFTYNHKKTARTSSGTLVANAGRLMKYHKVRSGDSLSKIAAEKRVSIDTLCKLNRITRKTVLRPGQILRCS